MPYESTQLQNTILYDGAHSAVFNLFVHLEQPLLW